MGHRTCNPKGTGLQILTKEEIMADYTLREIPGDLHKAWKSSAALKGWSMRDYIFAALQRQIQADLTKKEAKKDGAESKHDVENGA